MIIDRTLQCKEKSAWRLGVETAERWLVQAAVCTVQGLAGANAKPLEGSLQQSEHRSNDSLVRRIHPQRSLGAFDLQLPRPPHLIVKFSILCKHTERPRQRRESKRVISQSKQAFLYLTDLTTLLCDLG